MKKSKIEKAFFLLNEELCKRGIRGEIGIVGGAAMVLAFNARAATKDVDAIFKPSQEIREASIGVSEKLKLPEDWLNDSVKGFLPGDPENKNVVIRHENLVVWTPPADYLLAMKTISARYDSKDAEDIKILLQHLKLKSTKQVCKLVCRYYPEEKIPPKSKFFIEELFSSK